MQLVQACSQQWGSVTVETLQQLHQVHTWLLDYHWLAGGQGLAGTLTQQQLQQCKQARKDEMRQQLAKPGVGKFQRAVFEAVQRLPINWLEPPQMKQRSVGGDGVVDGAALINITAVTADGVRLAIEVDGPFHFRQPDGPIGCNKVQEQAAVSYRVPNSLCALQQLGQMVGQGAAAAAIS